MNDYDEIPKGICEYCGEKTDYFEPDPYDCEIGGDCKGCWICDNCYEDRSLEI